MNIDTRPRTDQVVERLRADVRGRVIMPADDDFDALRAVVPGGFDRRPAAIVRPADAVDVARVVAIVRDAGLELAVRGGGHSNAGHGTTEGGIVLDVRDLRGLDIDASTRTAWAGAGLTAGAYTVALGERGLATGFGDTASVGIGGITLGGGIGYLVRKHGLTIDSLVGAEIVTADGQVRVVDAEHEPDLFWAIRGGGGNFGVATRFRFALHDVGAITGGMLILPATPDVVASFIRLAEEAPEELSAIANVMTCPPLPFVAPEHHGRIVIMAILCHVGSPAAGERDLAPFRRLAAPIADMIRPMPYPQIYPPVDADYHPAAISTTMFVDTLDHAAAEAIVERLEASDAPLRVTQLRVLGGAMARVPADATAFAHRSSRYMVSVATFYQGPDDRPTREAWVKGLAGALSGAEDRAYVNFLGDEGPARVRAAYPGVTWDRLAATKTRYDPTNLFRLDQNIPPR